MEYVDIFETIDSGPVKVLILSHSKTLDSSPLLNIFMVSLGLESDLHVKRGIRILKY